MVEADDNNINENEKPKKSIFRKILKIFFYIILSILGVNVLLYLLLSIPAIQQKVADFAVEKLKVTLKTELSIDEVRLSLFNNATLKGVYIEDQSKDTLIYAKYIDVKLSPWELIKNNELAITGIALDDFVINVNQKDSISDYNFQFIVDAFAGDTLQSDTTKSSLKIVINDIKIKNGRLNYDVLSDSITPQLFNASHISVYDLETDLDLSSIDIDNLDVLLKNLFTN